MPIKILTDTTLRLPDDDPTPLRLVRPGARDLDAAVSMHPHLHDYGQLTCTLSGVLRVATRASSWIVPPQRAIWIPAGVVHEVTVLEKAQLRVLCIHASQSLFNDCKVLEVTPLLRETIVALCQLDDNDGTREQILGSLVLNEAARSATLPIHVPLPQDKRLQGLCNALLADPAIAHTLGEWAHAVGASERTLARLFDKELGMSFGQWRQQVRLAHAAPMIARGLPLARVAEQLGYASQSAFSAMFKKTFGVPPTAFF